MEVKKDYMLRTRLTPLEKKRLELIVLYLEASQNIKLTKARLLSHLLNKEFAVMQGLMNES
jgi:hypothetical protein